MGILDFLSHAAPAVAGARRGQLDRRIAGEERARKRTLEDAIAQRAAQSHAAEMKGRTLEQALQQLELDRANAPPPPKAPVPGTKEYFDMKRKEAEIASEFRPETGEPLVQVTGPEGRSVYTTRSKAVGMEAPSPSGMGSASIKTKVAGNRQQLSVIDDALKELEAYPGAVGLTRGLPVVGDRLDPRNDPKGVAARASIANIASLKIHDRSGAAVSIHEFPRLAPFIPAVYDPPEAIRIKLAKLREAIELETQELERSGTVAPKGSGARPAPSGGTPDHSGMSDEEFAAAWRAGKFKGQ